LNRNKAGKILVYIGITDMIPAIEFLFIRSGTIFAENMKKFVLE